LSTAAKTQIIICNGFKDLSFYKIAHLAAKIGNKIIIVIENISEINNIQDLLYNNVNIKLDFGIMTKPFDNCIHTQKDGLSLS
ncbi:arginine decarboxylase, partial [Francisella tularensis subsp. holarctica]|nr:arginine decarboxylase [Francisella tularensis subsp. holarctica]